MSKALQEKSFSSLFSIVCIISLLFLSGCAAHRVAEGEESALDPYESFNRHVYVFNDTVDTYIAAPISDVYTWVTPQFVQSGITNFFDNLKGINIILNDFMQGKGSQGLDDSARFLINTTLGLGGLFDVATSHGFERHEEDFAQTLAVWGMPQGPYWVIPLLGPTTTRGIPGGIFDAAANPVTYVGAPIQLLQVLNARANADNELNFIKEAALDPYVFTRESFLQYRNNLINDGRLEDADDIFDLDEDFDDEEFELEENAETSLNKSEELVETNLIIEDNNKEMVVGEDGVSRPVDSSVSSFPKED